MKQLSFAAKEYVKKPKETRKEKFLREMEDVVPWTRLLSVIEPHCPKAGNPRRQPYALSTMLRIHFMRAFLHLPREAANITLFFESRTRP